jgi:uncharacterized membrane protein
MLAVPERLVVLVFWTVKVRSTVVPTATLPKLVLVVGVTLKSVLATPRASAEQVLSFPDVSTAVMRATYSVSAVRDATTLDRVCPLAGDDVGEATVKNDALGQAGLEVPR